MIRNLLPVAVLTVVALASGCASVTSGKNQALTVQAMCGGTPLSGASCALSNSKGRWVVQTPGSVTIQKSYGDLAVECTKDGIKPTVGTFESSSNGGVWGNIVLGGVIGYAIDAGSGAGFDYPQQLTISFDPPCDSVAAATDAPS